MAGVTTSEMFVQLCLKGSCVFPHQNFLIMLQKTILKDKAVVDVFKVMLAAVNPIQGIVGRWSTLEAFCLHFLSIVHRCCPFLQQLMPTKCTPVLLPKPRRFGVHTRRLS